MAKTISYPKLPRPPRRQTPGKGQLPAVEDPIVRRLISDLQDRLSSVDRRFQDLDTFALKAGSPIPAYGQRIVNVGTPVHPNDAVPLWKLQQFVEQQAALIGRSSGEGGGDLSNEFGTIGAGSAPPTVALANLFTAVQDYIAANPADFANHCITSGGSWAFMTGLVAHLQGIDPRVGGNGKRGDTSDPSIDAVAYYHGTGAAVFGSKDVYVVDVIAASCSPGARADWNDVTTSAAAGAWLPTVP